MKIAQKKDSVYFYKNNSDLVISDAMRKNQIFTLFLLFGFFLCLAYTVAPSASAASDEDYTWTKATTSSPFTPRSAHTSVVFHDKIWIIGGTSGSGKYYNDVWSSSDGITWTQETRDTSFSPRYAHRSVVFDDRIWVIGGRDGSTMEPLNDVWYSTDGISWMKATDHAPFTPRWDFGIASHDKRIWVIGGSEDGIISNDVWYSSDGTTWKQATDDAGFSPRMNLAATAFDDKLWVIGGFDWNKNFNDVWSSGDGATWTQVTSHAPFGKRRYHNLETDGKTLFVISGIDDYPVKPYNDIWWSADGKQWEKIPVAETYPDGYSQSAVIFEERAWVIGSLGNRDEVWYLALDGSGSIPKAASQDTRILVQKTVVPVSIKRGMPVRLTIILTNPGPSAIHDIQVHDPVTPEFSLHEGINEYSFAALQPNETRIISYWVMTNKAGSHTLGETSVMFADWTGNYTVVNSNSPKITVIAPVISDGQQQTDIDSEISRIFRECEEFFNKIFS